MTACPPLEDIAAFLDGINLSPEERARITEHLARCESCYETFAGAVHFLEEERESSADDIAGGDVIPFRPLAQEKVQEKPVRIEPPQPVRRVSRWLPLAASVVLTAGLGYMVWQSYRALPDVTVAGVAEPLQGKSGVADALYQPEVFRGDEEEEALLPSSALPFLAGVYLIDLRLSDPAAKERPTEAVLASIADALEQMVVSPEIVTFFKNQSQQADLETLARELPKQESALERELAEEPLFRFGIWTEAGRLTAVTRSPKFFDQRANRRFLSAIPREIPAKDDPRYEPILAGLEKVAPLWDRDTRSAADYDALAGHFESIIDQFERIQKEDQEDLGLSPGSAEEFP